MRQTALILLTRLKIANNYAASIKNHLYIHLFAFVAVVAFLVLGGKLFFYTLFHYLDGLQDFGNMLMNRLIGMVMMAFFSMLVFSNLIITLSTTYISREIEHYMSQPVSHSSIFFVKLVESVVYSSWAFAILSLPLFLSFGAVRNVSLWFYVLIPLLVIPFLIVPAGIGALLTMLLSAYLPARRAMKWAILVTALVLLGGFAAVRLSGLYKPLVTLQRESVSDIFHLLKMGSHAWMPHYWMTQGMLALGKGNYREFGYWLMMMSSTALMLLQVCAWLAPRLYYRGWCLARDSRGAGNGGKTARLGRWFFGAIEKGLFWMRTPARAMAIKDLKTFWRDPAQWSQLIILFGLLFLYIAHLRSAYYNTESFYIFIPQWQVVLSYFNMGSTCFVLSILTTRFVYPMLSLEGKQFWVVGLAPMHRTRVVWQKFWLCWFACLATTLPLMAFSNWVLRVPPFMMVVSMSTLFLMSFGLTCLSVGLGAATPNFREDNPARIANGLGGTLNVILSLIYIGGMIGIEVYPSFLYFTNQWPAGSAGRRLLVWTFAGLFLLQAATMALPMLFGLRRWRRMEF